tara:strand:- start:346 stop:927 length:582 start_codon:yes stop_codon:yes gene_type:complete
MNQNNLTSSENEGLTWAKLSRFIALFFQPSRSSTYLFTKQFEEVPIDFLLGDGIKGILLDADGTMGPHHSRVFKPAILDHVQKMLQQGLKVAIYTNAAGGRFESFEKIGVKVVINALPKPDRTGFITAMKNFLDLDDPLKVCMIGDNYITDGGAVDAGMRFIHIQPLPGNEPFIHKSTRYLAYLCARMYRKSP